VSALDYQSGFGNEFATEAVAGTLPEGRNSPQRVAHGLYAEPTSAIVVAALPELVARGEIAEGDTVVAALTGSGLKDATAMAGILDR